LVGYYGVEKAYVDSAVSFGVNVMVLPDHHYQEVEEALGGHVTKAVGHHGNSILIYNKAVEGGGEKSLKIIFCKTLLDIVRYAEEEMWKPHFDTYGPGSGGKKRSSSHT